MANNQKVDVVARPEDQKPAAADSSRALQDDAVRAAWGARTMQPQQKVKADAVIEINSEKEFQEKVLKSKDSKVVDFGDLQTCYWCRVLKPEIDKLGRDYNGSVYSVDTGKNPWAQKYMNGQGIPQVFLFNDGQKTQIPGGGGIKYEQMKASLAAAGHKAEADSGDKEKKTGDRKAGAEKDDDKKPNKFQTADGSYQKDSLGRVIETTSKLHTRTFEYNNPTNPNQVTSFVMDGQAVYTRNLNGGFDVTEKATGRPIIDPATGKSMKWDGDLTMSKGGVFGIKSPSANEFRYVDALGNPLTKEQREARDNAQADKADQKDKSKTDRDKTAAEAFDPVKAAAKAESLKQAAANAAKQAVAAEAAKVKAAAEQTKEEKEAIAANEKLAAAKMDADLASAKAREAKAIAQQSEATVRLAQEKAQALQKEALDAQQALEKALKQKDRPVAPPPSEVKPQPPAPDKVPPADQKPQPPAAPDKVPPAEAKPQPPAAPDKVPPAEAKPQPPAAPGKMPPADVKPQPPAAPDKMPPADQKPQPPAAADKVPPADAKPQPPAPDKSPQAQALHLKDGAYHFDAAGNVSKTVSRDGLLKRLFHYDDKHRISRFEMESEGKHTVFERTGDKSFKVYAPGKEAEATSYQGDLMMSKKGVFTFTVIGESGKTSTYYRGAGATDLTPTEVERREKAPMQEDKAQAKDGSAADNKGASRTGDVQSFDGKQVKLEDGTYKRDDKGRVVEMVSADSATKRAFKYDDASNPNRVTTETINDKTEYRYLGPVTTNGQPLKQDGFEINSYSTYENGQLSGNWSGIRSVSENGVRSEREGFGNAEIKHTGADDKALTETQRAARDKDGIWPSEFETTSDDGTKYVAKLKGMSIQSVIETRTTDGRKHDITWTKDGDKWSSDQKPQVVRKNMEVRRDGSVHWEDLEGGRKHVLRKDGSSDIITDGVITTKDKDGNLKSITQPNGDSRTFGYSEKVGLDGKKELSTITTHSRTGDTTWTREAGADTWKSDGKESRSGLKVLPDGSLEFKSANGSKVRETKDFSAIQLDDKNRPVRITFESGSSRTFARVGGKVTSIADILKGKSGETTQVWTRKDDSDVFTTKLKERVVSRTLHGEPTADGDYSYLGADGKQRTDKVRDVERRARGEITVGSETVFEAREQLLDTARAHDIKTDRLEKYLDEFEKNREKYKLKDDQMVKTLERLTEILTSSDKRLIYSPEECKTLFETALHNIARPMEIDQGSHPTCNVTTVEIYAATRHPDEYARMVKEIGLTGKYTTADGKVVTPPSNALKPGDDERVYNLDKPNAGVRNLASQVVEMTLVNGLYETGGVVKNGTVRSDLRYVMDKSRWQPYGNGSMMKIGEDRLADRSGRPVQNSDGGPEFTQTEVLGSSKMMLGYNMPYIKGPYSMNGYNWNYDLPSADRLLDAKKTDKLPMGVPTIGGAHVQTIHDVAVDKQGTCWVLLDNQHGEKHDGWVTLSQLHQTQTTSMECTPTIRRWEKPPGIGN